ncbi:MAG: VOC family protein [Acidimicrobiales bacterium]
MGYHHVAIAARDLQETHGFYTEAMGFELIKAVVAPTPNGGWAKHVFYDTGGDGLIAFWELHDPKMASFDPAISTGLGLEAWVNHIAFSAKDLDEVEVRKQRLLDRGYDVMEIDHGFCVSIYTMDPNGVLVEFCVDTKPYTVADRDHALAVLRATAPELESPPEPVFHEAAKAAAPA